MKLILFSLFALACAAQPRIVIQVTDATGTVHTARITGTPAAAGLDSLTQWMATQTVCTPMAAVPSAFDATGAITTPAVPASQNCVPKYANPAELTKSHLITLLEGIVERFPSAITKATVSDIEARQAALAAARKALFDAARAER